MTFVRVLAVLLTSCVAVAIALGSRATADDGPANDAASQAVVDGPSIQRALDARPGETVYVPAGTFEVSAAIRITHDDAGLVGPGRIVQTNPDAPVVIVERAAGVRLRDVTLTRPAGQDANASALVADGCAELTVDGVRVLDNRAPAGAIRLDRCDGSRVINCLVRNYSRVAVDDRTANADLGYAFRCIDGTGIQVAYSKGVLIQGNRVVERVMVPTRDLQERHALGQFVKKNAVRGTLIGQEAWDAGYVQNWHQGSAIFVGGPEVSERIQILGNAIENAAQGIDVHADRVTIAHNTVDNAAVGMKAMHGSRNTLVIGNQFSRIDLWAIGLMPGAASRAAGAAAGGGEGADGGPAQAGANVDGGSVIANNIVSDFGLGHAGWVWGDARSPIVLERGQKRDNPPLSDVVVEGNVVYRTAEGPPRYRWAVSVDADADGRAGPVGVRFSNNVFHAGNDGVSNVPLDR